MTIVDKANWWDDLANEYGFFNDLALTIEKADLLDILRTYVSPNFSLISGSHFLGGQTSVLGSGSSGILVSTALNRDDTILGNKVADYLGGGSGHDVFMAGRGHDIINPGAGIDLVIGSAGLESASDTDTVTYLTATSGIIVDEGSPASSNPVVHTYSWSDLSVSPTMILRGFKAGAGGDIMDVSALLTHVGYSGVNPVADGYIRLANHSSGLKVSFDQDGIGSAAPKIIAYLPGVTTTSFLSVYNLHVAPGLPVDPVREAARYTFVSNDGQGAYDVLYSIENITGSKFDDVIHGRDDSANLLHGASGNDILYGHGGNDILDGGIGDDTVYGGAGDDFFLIQNVGSDHMYGEEGRNTFKFTGAVYFSSGDGTAIIEDFEAGINGDRLNVSELLKKSGYCGANAVADGFIGFSQSGDDTIVTFDRDGAAGSAPGNTLVTLKNIQASDISLSDNLQTDGTSILFASILGQSNARSMRILGADNESGLTRMSAGLDQKTDYTNIYTLEKNDDGSFVDVAVGGSVVNGQAGKDVTTTWWYPDLGKPGDILVRATDILTRQVADLRMQGVVDPVIVWGQGESDAFGIGSLATESARIAKANAYMSSTLSVFQYLRDQIGSDVQFYIMETGNYNVSGAMNAGISQATINATVLGLNYIRAMQEQMALNYDYIHMAVNYSDLTMKANAPSNTPEYDSSWPSDQWHLTEDSYEIVGDRVSDFIALDKGFLHVIDNAGFYPINALSDLTIHEGSGLMINGNGNPNLIAGTLGDDEIRGGAGDDIVNAGAGADILQGDGGKNTLMGGEGADTFAFFDTTAYDDADVVLDFSILQGDRIDITSLLFLYNASLGHVVTDFIQITEDGLGNTLLSIDKDGLEGTYTSQNILILKGVTGISNVLSLMDSGSLVTGISLNHSSPPLAADDVFGTYENVTIAGNVLADNGFGSDSDPDNDPLSIQAGTFSTEFGGTIYVQNSGNFIYTPAPYFHGSDHFDYTLSDGRGGEDTGTVTFDVVALVNHAPALQGDSFTGQLGQTITGNLLSNDWDFDGDSLLAQPVLFTTERGASVSINADGSFIYDPRPDFFGADRFDYSASDGHGGLAAATVNVNIDLPAGAIVGTESFNSLSGFDLVNDLMFGLGGDDTLKARSGNDIVFGGAGNDMIEGNDGNDVLYGGAGVDTLKGGNGSDTFAFLRDDGGQADIIKDFKIQNNDKLDVSDLLEGYDPLTHAITDFVEITTVGGSSVLKVDADGLGTVYSFTRIATLEAVTGLTDEAALLASGKLIVL